MADVILVFNSVHQTLMAEKLLNSAKLSFLVVPVPPFVNEGCGLGIRIAKEQLEQTQKILQQAGITLLKVVELENK